MEDMNTSGKGWRKEVRMAKELERAVAGLKEAMGKNSYEHEGWAVLRGDNRPVNGCYEAKGYYKPKAK